jgi:Flp pilus assembly pilin Flp
MLNIHAVFMRETFARALRDTRGVAMTEYIILIGTVALGSFASFVLLGAAFVRNFNVVRTLILAPFP